MVEEVNLKNNESEDAMPVNNTETVHTLKTPNETFIREVNVLIKGINLAQKCGVYSLEDSAALFNAINNIKFMLE